MIVIAPVFEDVVSNTIPAITITTGAERGVKLASNFLCGTKNKTCLQNILQVVENDRNATPNQRKPTKASENWFLY